MSVEVVGSNAEEIENTNEEQDAGVEDLNTLNDDAELEAQGLPPDADGPPEQVSGDYFGAFVSGNGNSRSEDETVVERPRTPSAQQDTPSSPADTLSIPDDTPSVQHSRLSSPGSVATPRSRKYVLRTASGALQPFERRFESRLTSSPLSSPSAASPAFLNPGSRQISLSSLVSPHSSQGAPEPDEPPSAPWDVVRWTRLRKLTGQIFSEVGRRNFGRPTCLAVSALIAVGTTKGFVLGFDYHQTLKIIMGPGTKAAECGSVTALAIAADYSTICSGHASGHIFTWEISRPARPFLHIPPISRSSLKQMQHPDGHIADYAVLHIGFLGTRHTALVSADSSGMAFSHLASRGLGPVTRSISTTRLLGRYPSDDPQLESARKPSSVLAFAPLPLGNVEQPTDTMGLTALLTPYLLVIVSTTPSAQTQHKSARPKEVTPHSTLSGCLAWFPSVKIKGGGKESDKDASDAKLVYCWSNVLSILDVHAKTDPNDPQRPPDLDFSTTRRWRAEEPIVAVQWLGRSVLGVLTISQRLLILEDETLQVTDSLDLLQRRIYHQDLYSRQLHAVVERLDAEDPSMHGVVADAFHMSFRAYKGRLFLLSFNDLAVGTLSNWADRLVALMEAGDHIAAIRLATDYYSGSVNNVSVGLPDNDTTRHEMVRERLIAMLTASLQYTFAQEDATRSERLDELALVSFDACVTMNELDFLLKEVFDFYEEVEEDAIFVRSLESYVLDNEIKQVPPEVVKSLVQHFVSQNEATRLEEILCRLEPQSFDLDQMTTLCKQHNLYDALIYVWTEAIRDYVTPLTDLLELIKLAEPGSEDDAFTDSPFYDSAMKIFPYLAFSFTSRAYPSGEIMGNDDAFHAKADLYEYLFSGTPIAWPPGSKKVLHTTGDHQSEPAYPYLVLLLQFDTANVMGMLNEAFEDSFLNETDDDSNQHRTNGDRSGYRMIRQRIIEVMRDVMQQNEFDAEDIVYLDMFIARSLPKYSTQLVLSGSVLNSILQRLCRPPSPLLHDDCQLSVEYLLSVYQTPDINSLIESLKQAKFYRALKTIYRRQKLYLDLFEIFFEDPENQDGVFEYISFCMSASSLVTAKQRTAISSAIVSHADDLTEIDTIRTAKTLSVADSSLLQQTADALHDSHKCFIFLRTLFEPHLLDEDTGSAPLQEHPKEERQSFEEHYVQLMCVHEPGHVAEYVSRLQSGDLRIAEVLPAMENGGVIDAEVMLLTRDGSLVTAMNRLVKHMQSLQQTLMSLLNAVSQSPDIAATSEAAGDLAEDVTKYTKVGIWLCQGASANVVRRNRPPVNFAEDINEDDLDLDEHLWLELLDAVVQLTQAVLRRLHEISEQPISATQIFDPTKLQSLVRPNVQETFTALLIATAHNTNVLQNKNTKGRAPNELSFLRVLRAFLQRAATTAPSLADLRDVLADIFSAYAFEQDVLTLANDLLGSDVFTDIQKAHELRQRGWRPRTQVCEGCKRRAWGAGIGEVIWDEWISKEYERQTTRTRKALARASREEARRLRRGKGRIDELQESAVSSPAIEIPDEERRKLSLVVFACRHVWHRVCLDPGYAEGRPPTVIGYRCPLCTESS
ncbi:hypothetical protein AMS68_001993 [Peltaster fructicola]|uniref:Uncharacterized protein n=1 Tax=Peltaster fructicola TaxID=286661 RepID=A0A6H0XP67_9PEZI|nr:hypothetical protein AMS68_001993 [Peltaster fructicola]